MNPSSISALSEALIYHVWHIHSDRLTLRESHQSYGVLTLNSAVAKNEQWDFRIMSFPIWEDPS